MRISSRVAATAAVTVLVGAALATGGPSASGATAKAGAAMRNAAGSRVGSVYFRSLANGDVLVKAYGAQLTPGFHGFHIHTTGVCDPEAKDTSGATVPFFSAGGHYNPASGNTHRDHAGDLPPLLATDAGTAAARVVTDRFELADLFDQDGSAVIIHGGPDNMAHIPPTSASGGERYHSHVDNVFGPDTLTKATGDAGARFACGVVRAL